MAARIDTEREKIVKQYSCEKQTAMVALCWNRHLIITRTRFHQHQCRLPRREKVVKNIVVNSGTVVAH